MGHLKHDMSNLPSSFIERVEMTLKHKLLKKITQGHGHFSADPCGATILFANTDDLKLSFLVNKLVFNGLCTIVYRSNKPTFSYTILI